MSETIIGNKKRYRKSSELLDKIKSGEISGQEVSDIQYDMATDLEKQEKEYERKKDARFSGLKKLLRGE